MHSASSLHSLDYRLYAMNSRWPLRRAQLEYNQAVSVVPTLPNRAARCDLLVILGPTEYPRSLLASSAETLSSDSPSLPIARALGMQRERRHPRQRQQRQEGGYSVKSVSRACKQHEEPQ